MFGTGSESITIGLYTDMELQWSCNVFVRKDVLPYILSSRKAMNVTYGTRYVLLNLYPALAKIMDTKIESIFAAVCPGDMKDSLVLIKAARQALGYEPIMGWEEGLRRTVEWYQS
jgi:nucleoside-diphosphate-sugar epimerase